MERSSLTRWIFIALAIFLFWQFGLPLIQGKKGAEIQPAPVDLTEQPAPRADEKICTIEAGEFRAELSSRGGALRSFILQDKRFDDLATKKPKELVTTTREGRMPLRTDLRAPGDAPGQQVAFDDFDWTLDAATSNKTTCVFMYADASTALQKTITATGKPYELAVSLDVKNLAAEPRRHRLSVEETDWLTPKDTEGGFGRQSEMMSEAIAVTNAKTERLGPGEFKPGEFKNKEFTPEGWRRTPGEAKVASVSSVYFTKLLLPQEGPGPAMAETRVEEWWDKTRTPAANREKDPSYGHVYRSRIAYAEQTLQPGGHATYKLLSYSGPKDRRHLQAINRGAEEVLNLGMFTMIVKVLVAYLYKLQGFIGSWGWAIVLMTITVRTLLFPLSLSQIKNSVAMRRLKPEMDELNEKYKDDAAQRGLALQELWRKNGVSNPVIGCLPMLLQLPVWWALYTALQTAVELYHVPFGPVIPDLSAPGKYFIIPIVLGASSFFQQKLMPAQGDPQQQKMMLYMMPGIFTVMMLFLPAGLGVYMLTNSVLAIVQQLVVERYLKTQAGPGGQIEVREKTTGDGGKPTPALGKGKARARG
jgi:YidC/Oxa1 family membrane protein insertase